MSDPLPAPTSNSDLFLMAVHDQLGATNEILKQILDRLPAAPPERTDGTVELREPKTPTTKPKTEPGEKRPPAETPGGARPAARRKTTPKKTGT